MQKLINQKLQEIETRENIKILHCIESGSRAWGFASPDSDYDVRFVYVRPIEHYLRLDKKRDVVEWQLDDTLDINGWDVSKFLQLLYKSNPTTFEWNSSPIVYKTTKEWGKIAKIVNDYFDKKSGLYHYLSMAKTNYRTYLKTENVKLKKYFYVLRPILACKWILEKENPPPMLFETLVEQCLDDNMKSYVSKLLDLKINSPEITEGKRIDELNAYIEENLILIEESTKKICQRKLCRWQGLNETFIKLLNQ